MAAATIVTCPNCGTRNRIRSQRTGVPRCSVCHAALPWIVDADASTFDEEIVASVPVLVDFWAPWCGPCRMVSPAVERLGQSHAGELKVVKLDVDGAPEIAGRYDVQGIPLLVLIRDGHEVDRLVGAAPEPTLRQWLEERLERHESVESG
ncbi:MAG: thioredoxin 2 [Solirubrobacteraceae bacterium]|jgi:thioredoxin 2|nr:thioredoxin 2 [Solirubrobacteraceae bacterium]MEA2395327.1 thioredoxin 2 [Solirubrobacteraceae bacterium]